MASSALMRAGADYVIALMRHAPSTLDTWSSQLQDILIPLPIPKLTCMSVASSTGEAKRKLKEHRLVFRLGRFQPIGVNIEFSQLQVTCFSPVHVFVLLIYPGPLM